MPARLTRRSFVLASLLASNASALGRTPLGGVLRLVVPFRLIRLDPHALHDPVAALFGSAVADPLFALDALGRPYPALARSLPEVKDGAARVTLRSGLRTARGRALTAADVTFSIARARQRGAGALLAAVPTPSAVRGDSLALDFARTDPGALAVALASPLVAILPRNFTPLEPDGTGAFAARFAGPGLELTRNPNAARGPAFLERIEVGTVSDLADALRNFEDGSVDVGWLGAGLYRPRRGAVPFRGAHYGWAVLRLGKGAGAWAAPGVAQQLLDAIDPARLRHLGLEGLPARASSAVTWGGGPASIHVLEDAPQLVLIAHTLAEALGRPGHELRVVIEPYAEIERRRASRDFAMMVDFVRTLGPPGPMTQQALLAAQNPELAKKPPRLTSYDARAVGAGLTLGVVGELWVAGAHAPQHQNLAGWSLGSAFRLPE